MHFNIMPTNIIFNCKSKLDEMQQASSPIHIFSKIRAKTTSSVLYPELYITYILCSFLKKIKLVEWHS